LLLLGRLESSEEVYGGYDEVVSPTGGRCSNAPF
jgi:hypothetical protein